MKEITPLVSCLLKLIVLIKITCMPLVLLTNSMLNAPLIYQITPSFLLIIGVFYFFLMFEHKEIKK
jgi:hypothetical protein